MSEAVKQLVINEDLLKRVLQNQVSMMRWMDAPPSTFKREMAETEALLERMESE